jgi:hypothetical protein
MNDNGYDLGELVKFIENMKNPTKEIIEKIKDKFYLSFEPRPEDYKLSGMIVIGEAGIIGKRLHETFPEHFFKSNGEDAWLSDFEGVVCSDGLILLSPGNIYTEFSEPLLDKLTEVSEWLKEKECNSDSFDWEKFIKTPEYKDMFNSWIAGGNMDWMTDYSNILSNPANSTATNTYTSSNISNTVTSASTGANTITICTDGIMNTLLDITGVSNYKN